MTRKARPFAELEAKVMADPVRRARVEERVRAIEDALALAELRAQRGLSQREVARKLAVSQANVSRVERGGDLYLSTLRSYVEALGGHLEIAAVFDDERVTVKVGEPK